jgi:peptidoglycan/LPS O-acetylase OafA/YrhL
MPALKNPSSHFRRDIQGLRALAVLAVIGDHVLQWPRGGYLGVDVFFVISGYLITSLLVRELDRSGRVSLRDFYVRRLKRIMPLAALVLAVTLATAYATFNTVRFHSTAIDEAWATLFGANWRFAAVGTDYFQNQGPVSPIQHYWSLSVEEQFYLVWPLVLVLLLAVTRRRARSLRLVMLAGVMSVIVIVSFVFALTETASNPAVAYFSTFTRAWELGVGVLIGLGSGLWSRLPQPLRPFLTWAGLTGILASFWFLDTSHPVPGPWAGLPVLACALVIIAGSGASIVACPPLTNRVSGYLGDLSYALYLWHFPVLILAESALPPGSSALLPFVFAITALLSVGSHHLLEVPIIRSPWLAHGLSHDQRSRRWRQWRGDMGPRLRRTGLGVFAGATALVVTIALVPTPPPRAP